MNAPISETSLKITLARLACLCYFSSIGVTRKYFFEVAVNIFVIGFNAFAIAINDHQRR